MICRSGDALTQSVSYILAKVSQTSTCPFLLLLTSGLRTQWSLDHLIYPTHGQVNEKVSIIHRNFYNHLVIILWLIDVKYTQITLDLNLEPKSTHPALISHLLICLGCTFRFLAPMLTCLFSI